MGKGHKDNHAARKKATQRGVPAFEIKAERRKEESKAPCNLCGTKTRKAKLVGGLCPKCNDR
jgi:hypothetical protein